MTPAAVNGALQTNGSLGGHLDFFSQLQISTPAQQLLKQLDPAPSEPHSPGWGSGSTFTQPLSRAGPHPPSSVLEHLKANVDLKDNDFSRLKKLFRTDSSLGFDDGGFSGAGWSIEVSDRGNGGLRNAIKAAADAGSLHEKTWVGTLGMPTDALEDKHQRTEIENRLEDEYECLTVWCKDSDMDGHYTHYCKQVRGEDSVGRQSG